MENKQIRYLINTLGGFIGISKIDHLFHKIILLENLNDYIF